MAVPFDYPIVGYGNHIVNTLRIWDAEAITDFQLDSFDKGEYDKAVEQKNLAKNIVEVLYPNDNHYEGKELRLKQQYFFVSASLQAAVAKYKKNHDDITKLYEKMTIQMNDTHPTVSVAELMRILMDEEGLGWDEAWEVTTKTCAYTNHTIMAEASLMKYIVEKGSIAIDGISLTVAKRSDKDFSISMIPHTAKETILSQKKAGDVVNLENDIIGKYVEQLLQYDKKEEKQSRLTKEFLLQAGF